MPVLDCPPLPEKVAPLLWNSQPCCIVMDVPVDDPSGYKLLQRLRRWNPDAVLVVLTNHFNREFRERSLNSGADYFLEKSKEVGRLVEVLNKLGGNRSDC